MDMSMVLVTPRNAQVDNCYNKDENEPGAFQLRLLSTCTIPMEIPLA